jgi:hypothetical protein
MGKSKRVVTEEELSANQLLRIMEHIQYIPNPTYKFDIGEQVGIGNLENACVTQSLEDGKIYKIDYTNINNNYGRPIIKEHLKGYWQWTDIRPIQSRIVNDFIKNSDLELNYHQASMLEIFGKKYHFGLEMDADYQRGNVWTLEDNCTLIHSIFNNIDIGKFVFVKLEWNEHPLNYSYEVLDGKQRITAILEFYENKFAYNGLFFNQLSRQEQCHLTEYHVNIAEISHLSREQKIRFFLILNTSGKVMDKEHLKKVESMLEEES